MAAHGTPEYSTATGNDYPEHEETYRKFTFLVLIGIILVINICIGLTVGGVRGNWWFAGPFIFIAHIPPVIGLMTGAKMPSYVMLAIGFLGLAFA
jgi:Bacterial aa3 type cytochrome c oxidase subunit IV